MFLARLIKMHLIRCIFFALKLVFSKILVSYLYRKTFNSQLNVL